MSLLRTIAHADADLPLFFDRTVVTAGQIRLTAQRLLPSICDAERIDVYTESAALF
jgi:hypothetical protein